MFIYGYFLKILLSSPENTSRFLKNIGHYSQVVWGETTKIGCGYAEYPDGEWSTNRQYLVCNYGPGANLPGAIVYHRKDGKC